MRTMNLETEELRQELCMAFEVTGLAISSCALVYHHRLIYVRLSTLLGHQPRRPNG